MPEPERRRRRVRPSSSAAVPAPPTDDETPVPPGSGALTEPAHGGTAAGGPGERDAAAAVTNEIADVDQKPTPSPADIPGERGIPGERISGERGGADRGPRPAQGRRPFGGPGGAPGNGNGNGGGDEREAERGLRGLVGSGSSQVSVGAALRARDAARPTEEHLADADRNLTIVRRNWVPREELPRNR
jgi:hypothetical protein